MQSPFLSMADIAFLLCFAVGLLHAVNHTKEHKLDLLRNGGMATLPGQQMPGRPMPRLSETQSDPLITLPIEPSFVATDSYGSIVTIESLSINHNSTFVTFRADNIQGKKVALCPVVPVDSIGGYTDDYFLIDDHGKRYHFKSESQIYAKSWWNSRECRDIFPGDSIRFTYEFERLDPGVVNVKLHRGHGVFPIRILDNRRLAEKFGTNIFPPANSTAQSGGQELRIQPISGWKFSDGVVFNVERIVVNHQNVTVIFRAQATRNSSVCPPAPLDALRERAALNNYITDGTGDHYELIEDLTSYPDAVVGGMACRPLAEGEIARIHYVYRRLEQPVTRIEIHIQTHDDLATFPVNIYSTFPPSKSGTKGDLQPLSCSAEITLKSVPSATKTSIQFMNRSAETRYVYWLDSTGGRLLYKVLNPGESYIQRTFMGHIWLVTNGSQSCGRMFRAQQIPARAILR